LSTARSPPLKLARDRCDALRQADADALLQGFAPLARGAWTNENKLAVPAGCPACGHGQPTVLEEDLGWSRERCAGCDSSYDRTNVLFVLGEESEAGYL
jgi:hypothetical protein